MDIDTVSFICSERARIALRILFLNKHHVFRRLYDYCDWSRRRGGSIL